MIVGELVAVPVGEFVGVAVGLFVAVEVGVLVLVLVGVLVGVTVGVVVGVFVAVEVGLAVGVLVFHGSTPTMLTPHPSQTERSPKYGSALCANACTVARTSAMIPMKTAKRASTTLTEVDVVGTRGVW